jgi:hypothetical protein
MSTCIFYPSSNKDFVGQLADGQRYRHAFGDTRLAQQHTDLLRQMTKKQSIVIHQLSAERSEQVGFYRFINNPRVTLPELIVENCRIEEELVKDKDILVLQDSTAVGLRSKLKKRADWGANMGVIDDNRTPGFYVHCSLVVEQERQLVVGLGNIIVYTRPLNTKSKAEKVQARVKRRKLPLEEQESFVWPLGVSNSAKQLSCSRRFTTVMDQGADKYEVLARILADPARHLIVRSKEDRKVIDVNTGSVNRLSILLEQQPWANPRQVAIRALNHYSKSHARMVQRQARNAQLYIRYLKVQLEQPSGYAKSKTRLDRTLYVVEVKEDAHTVPVGEQPIHWRLISSWPLDQVEQAWQVVESYQARWNIEQLFRVFKKQGLCIEYSQLKHPEVIKKQAVMALKIATQAMQLTLARDGNPFIPIETMFDEQQQQALLILSRKLSGNTPKQANPHLQNSLAWAAWVIARLGGWTGYKSQRPPGPITMKRGLQNLDKFIWACQIINDT